MPLIVYIHFTSNYHNRVKRGVIQAWSGERQDLWNRGSGSRGGPPKVDLLEEWLPREVHRKCNDTENQTEGTACRRDSDKVSNPRRKTLCILPYEKGTSDNIVDICRNAGVHWGVYSQEWRDHRSTWTRVWCTRSLVHSVMRSTLVKQEDHWRPGSVNTRAVATGDARNATATH